MKQDIFSLISQILIPVLVAIITYIIARKQITNAGVTQFRQNWIDNLRDAISIYVAKAEMITILDFDDDESYLEHFKELSQMQHKIELLLNPNESDHQEIVTLINNIRDIIHDEEIDEKELDKKTDNYIDRLMEVTKRVLKREWNIVKKGK